MQNDVIANVRQGYDRIATSYGQHFAGELEHKPLDRALLSRFAACVSGKGRVADLGCGPGHIAAYLHDAGLTDIAGIDLSPAMIAEARQRQPHVAFQVGDMLALDLPDASLAGVVAMYAIVNIPRLLFGTVFGEMQRVLHPEGRLLLSFHIGDETVHREELFGEAVSMDFHFLQPADVGNALRRSGFAIEEIVEREPYAPEVEYQSRRAYVFAVKR